MPHIPTDRWVGTVQRQEKAVLLTETKLLSSSQGFMVLSFPGCRAVCAVTQTPLKLECCTHSPGNLVGHLKHNLGGQTHLGR